MQTMSGDNQVWQFYCSWPAGSLGPNSTQPQGARTRAKRDQKAEAYLLACRHIPAIALHKLKQSPKVKVHLQFIRPNKAQRNIETMQASCDGVLQGLSAALEMDIERLRVTADMDSPPVRPGGVRIVVSEL
jgi:hypothetical protein